ncbi:MAG TPA: MDR family MFS transporter [Burkholderiales bacterium]|nr:MDR family MFS transporter [Burkholderiales bacterium]
MQFVNQDTVKISNHQRSFRESLLAMMGLFFVVMMVALDQTVVGTALPTIVADLKGFDLYAWVATSYLLTSVITVPIFGRLGDFFGRKYFVVASIIIFTLASALCGLASSMSFLVIARSLQGIGGGMLVGTAFACVPDLFPDPHARLQWQIIISTAFGLANAIGPSLGGFLTQYYGWRSVFYVNLPIGILSLWFVWRHMPHIRNSYHRGSMSLDWIGALLIALVLGSLQLFVEFVLRQGTHLVSTVFALVCIGAIIGLLYHERRAKQPVLPLEMFRERALSALFMLSVCIGFILFAWMFYLPLMLQGGFGLSPNAAGLIITPLVVCITVGSIASGRLITRIPSISIIMNTGIVLLIAAGVGMTVLEPDRGHVLTLTYMIVGGLGIGLVMPNLTIFTQELAGRSHLGIATALIQSFRMVGGMIGTALVGSVVNRFYTSSVSDYLDLHHASALRTSLTDPQILVNPVAKEALKAHAQIYHVDGALLIDMARQSLIHSVHVSLILPVGAAIGALWLMRRVPPMKLSGNIRHVPLPVDET